MRSRPRAERAAWLALALCTACSPFEPPLPADDASTRPVQPEDAGTDAMSDATRDDARADGGDLDAGVTVDASADASLEDATSDAAIDAAVMIPRRPALARCGFLAPVSTGTVVEPGLNEVSGMAVSRRNPRVLWIIEDSGNGAIVHAVNDTGALVATYTLGGNAIDYEDIAVGPGPEAGVSYLYIADIGDNNGSRATVVVYRAPEPEVQWDQARTTGALPQVTPFPMRYPSGARNAEALMVDVNQDFYVVTKDGFTRPNTVYRLAAPHQAATPRTLEEVASLFGGAGTDLSVTAGDISADGSRIIIRTLRSATHWSRAPGQTIVQALQTATPCDAELASENKGESISLDVNGYYSISEGTGTPINFVAFTP
jgi:hypothetical protein